MNDYSNDSRKKLEKGDRNTTDDKNSRNSGKHEELPSNTIMIRNLTSSIDEDQIRTCLDEKQASYVTVRLLRDRRDGRSRGIAFVEFVTTEDARSLMQSTRGELKICGHSARLAYSNSRDDGRFDSHFPWRNDPVTNTIMLRGVPTNANEAEIKKRISESAGRVTDIRLIRDKKTNMPRGFGFIEFETNGEAQRWMEYQKGVFKVDNLEIRLVYTQGKPGGPPAQQQHQQQQQSSHHSGGATAGEFSGVAASLAELSSRGGIASAVDSAASGDWNCARCGAHNFKRRENCYKCHYSRTQSQSILQVSDGSDQVGSNPCNTLILRELDALCTEDDIVNAFTNQLRANIINCQVMRDESSIVSRCFAFLELVSVAEARRIIDAIAQRQGNGSSGGGNESAGAPAAALFEISGKLVSVYYARNTFATTMSAMEQQKQQQQRIKADAADYLIQQQHGSMLDRKFIAQNNCNISANSGAAVADAVLQKQNQINSSNNNNKHDGKHKKKDTSNSVAASSLSGDSVASAQSNHNAVQSNTAAAATVAASFTITVNGKPYNTQPTRPFRFDAITGQQQRVEAFPAPDTSTFLFDESTNYYYDPMTGLYYSAQTQCFFDRLSQQFLYWDNANCVYQPISQSHHQMLQQQQQEAQQQQAAVAAVASSDSSGAATATQLESGAAKSADDQQKLLEKERRQKAKDAKKVVKDMERWARNLNNSNSKKSLYSSSSSSLLIANQSSEMVVMSTAGAGMAGFTALECGNSNSSLDLLDQAAADSANNGASLTTEANSNSNCNVSNEEVNTVCGGQFVQLLQQKESELLQWENQLACMLCSRGFKSREMLEKHVSISELHKTNLDKLRGELGLPPFVTALVISAKQQQNAASTSTSSAAADVVTGMAGCASTTGEYRDRAKERRDNFGLDPSPPVKRSRDRDLSAKEDRRDQYEQPEIVPEPPKSLLDTSQPDNVSARMMAKMGWQGKGLGRREQGRVDTIQTELRKEGMGLGAVGSRKSAPDGDNYKDNLKKAMFARYHERD